MGWNVSKAYDVSQLIELGIDQNYLGGVCGVVPIITQCVRPIPSMDQPNGGFMLTPRNY